MSTWRTLDAELEPQGSSEPVADWRTHENNFELGNARLASQGPVKQVGADRPLEAVARGAGSGITAGMIKYPQAALRSAFVPGYSYDQALADTRAEDESLQESNPKSYLAGEVGGGLYGSVLPAGFIGRGVGAAGKIGRGAGVGAGYGSAGGFSANQYTTPEDSLMDTGIGAAAGGLLGAAGQGVARLGANRIRGELSAPLAKAEANVQRLKESLPLKWQATIDEGDPALVPNILKSAKTKGTADYLAGVAQRDALKTAELAQNKGSLLSFGAGSLGGAGLTELYGLSQGDQFNPRRALLGAMAGAAASRVPVSWANGLARGAPVLAAAGTAGTGELLGNLSAEFRHKNRVRLDANQ